MLRKIKKGPKKGILALFLSFDHLVCDRKQFQNFKPSSYMATHTKFGIDPTDLVPLIAHGIGSSMKFLDCLAKKTVFVTLSNTLQFDILMRWCFPLRPSTIEPSLIHIENGAADLRPRIICVLK